MRRGVSDPIPAYDSTCDAVSPVIDDKPCIPFSVFPIMFSPAFPRFWFINKLYSVFPSSLQTGTRNAPFLRMIPSLILTSYDLDSSQPRAIVPYSFL